MKAVSFYYSRRIWQFLLLWPTVQFNEEYKIENKDAAYRWTLGRNAKESQQKLTLLLT
jgi:hypothetical protein